MESSTAEKFRVGLVQMSCALDPNENLEKADLAHSRSRRAAARRSCACRSCSGPSISAAKKMPSCLLWPNRFPGHPPKRWAALARELGIVIIASLFRAA